jgi:hypothetical protein
MNRQHLQAEFDRIGNHIALLREKTGKAPDELISLGCQHVCVTICGSLEQLLKQIFIEYARRKSSNQIFKPIERVCESYQNPKHKKVLELIALFDDEFEEEQRALWDGSHEAERNYIDSLGSGPVTALAVQRLS